MISLRFILPFLLLPLLSCGQNASRHKPDSAAVVLVKKAAHMLSSEYNDRTKEALSMLDEATKIDPDYFGAYSTQVVFYQQLKDYRKAIVAINNCLRLSPRHYIFCTQGGVCYENLGDTLSSKVYFERSLAICTERLDTMNTTNEQYYMVSTGKAINLILLGKTSEANAALTLLDSKVNTIHFQDPNAVAYVSVYTHFLMDKNKAQLMDYFNNPQKYDAILEPQATQQTSPNSPSLK